MNQLTKSEIYHIVIGLIAATVWVFGKEGNLPADAITYAQTLTIAVCAHALGSSNAVPSASLTDIAQVSLSQSKGDSNV